jgi:hypothetical protein
MESRMIRAADIQAFTLATCATLASFFTGQAALAASALFAAQVSYPAPGKEPVAKMEFPSGATPISGPEIVAALSNHTAMLPGGFVEYYAPDGSLHGLAEGKHYSGHWEVRNGDFCTLLQDSDSDVCSPVERRGDTLYWSVDGEPEASPVTIVAGNPQGLN